MSELALALIADFGVPLLFVVTFLSCLAIPVPSSLLMLASGGFAATEDLALASVVLAAYAGAVLGDNAGYWMARALGVRLTDWLSTRPRRAHLYHNAQGVMDRWGGSGIFFSRWLVAPLGPYVNYASGLAKLGWPRFALWSMTGEMAWVGIYVGLGFLFSENIVGLATLLGDISGFLVAIVIVIGLGAWLWHASHKRTGKSFLASHM